MWEWLKESGTSVSNFANKNADGLNAIGSIIGNIGGAYGSVKSYQAMEDANNMMKAQYNRAVAKEDKAQNVWDMASANVFGDKKKKNSATFDLSV
jgi:hypothetical protein